MQQVSPTCDHATSASLCSMLPSSYALITLGYYKSNASQDVWVTSAAITPHTGYQAIANAPQLPMLATADWSTVLRNSRGNSNRTVHQRHSSSASMSNNIDRLSLDQLQFICPRTDLTSTSSGIQEQCEAYLKREEESLSASESPMLPVYGCVHETGDHFVSRDKSCLGQTFLRTLGYVASNGSVVSSQYKDFYAAVPFKMAALYSCYDKNKQDSCLDSSATCAFCGGQAKLLGYGFLV